MNNKLKLKKRVRHVKLVSMSNIYLSKIKPVNVEKKWLTDRR